LDDLKKGEDYLLSLVVKKKITGAYRLNHAAYGVIIGGVIACNSIDIIN